jgi:dimethylsulfoniopropionate demethylase
MEKVFGVKINQLKFFRYDFFNFKEKTFLISRSGYSKQGGFEIHIEDVKAGLDLYDYLFEIGDKFNLKPGTPNHPERIEGGLLSYGSDMDICDNPFECGFDKYIDLESDIVFLGKENLKKIIETGIKKKIMGVKIEAKSINISEEIPMADFKGQIIGHLRSAAFSPSFKKVVGLAMIKKDFCHEMQKFQIKLNNSLIEGEVCNLPIK